MKLIKFKRDDFIYPEYGIIDGQKVRPIKNFFSISEIFLAIKDGKIATDGEINLREIQPLPPTDENAHIYCAGLNYIDHAKEVKMPVPQSPIFFSKSIGAICGAYDNITYPGEVSLLDYEIELGIIIGKKIGRRDRVDRDNLSDYVLGISILNDISARDIQLMSGQWFLGKSYRSFAPFGPYIQVLDKKVIDRIDNLDLELTVTSKDNIPYEYKLQKGNTNNMIFKVEDLIKCLSEKFDLRPGDIIATGTPCGVALSHPSRLKIRIAEILGIPEKKRLDIFLKGEKKNNKKYLEIGDTVTARISSSDGKVDLGEQKNPVISEK